MVKGYTGFCIRVRRASDNSELDIGFVGEEIDALAISSFAGINGTAWVTRIYFQTLLTFSVANPFLSIISGDGARIYSPLNSGDGFIRNNGKLYTTSAGVAYRSDTFDLSLGETFFTDNCLVSTVYRTESTARLQGIFEEVQVSNTAFRVVQYQDTTANKYILNARPSGSDSFLAMPSALPVSTYNINSIIKNTSNQYQGYYDGVLGGTSAVDTRSFASDTRITLFRQIVGGVVFDDLWAETVVFKNPSAGVVTDVINNQKTFYSL